MNSSGLPTGAMRVFGESSSGPRRPGLVLLYAEEHERLPSAWPLGPGSTVVGRENADLTLPVAAVSRRHAEIFRSGDGWAIRDLGSTNGTLVDGHRIDECELEPDVDVRIGDAFLKLVEDDADYYRAFRVDGTMAAGTARMARAPTTLVGGLQMDRVAAELERIAPTELSVLLLGESGTGKEVAASELHVRSGRRGMLAAVNCAAIPANLLESELFGYKRGAFSGAERDRVGLVKTAHEGTLLLDEIGDMPLEAQAKLLRVLQSKEVVPLGSTTPERVDVRVVCATHRDLRAMQRDGKFREDLYARLNEHTVQLPALRNRKEDVYLLVRTFLQRHGRPDVDPSFRFMMGLLHYDWPYNVRELEACIKRALALCDGRVLLDEHLPDAIKEELEHYGAPLDDSGPAPRAALPSSPPPALRGTPSRDELIELLRAHHGNVAAVGRQFGKARMQVHRWMKVHGIDVGDFRD